MEYQVCEGWTGHLLTVPLFHVPLSNSRLHILEFWDRNSAIVVTAKKLWLLPEALHFIYFLVITTFVKNKIIQIELIFSLSLFPYQGTMSNDPVPFNEIGKRAKGNLFESVVCWNALNCL
jgi:hypothetical protein